MKLNAFEHGSDNNRETIIERLNSVLKRTAEEINEELKIYTPDKEGVGFVDDNAQIFMPSFKIKNGGPFSQEEIRHDQRTINNCLDSWGMLYDENTKKRYEEKAGKKLTADDMRQIYIQEQQKTDGHLTEVVVTILLHRYLKNHTIVARTSSYDDYQGLKGFNSRVDHLLIDKKTGKTICTFDDVEFIAGQQERVIKKQEKINKITSSGGAHIKYGLSLDNNDSEKNLVRGELHNVPAFYLQIDKETLHLVANELSINHTNELTDSELNMAKQLVKQLKQQLNTILNDPQTINAQLKQNLLTAQELFNSI